MSLPRLIAAASLAAALAACGQLAPLEPAAGEQLPVKPLMARSTPTAEELLQPPTYARPERVDELMKRSQPREQDRFDLPPPAGGSVPLPAGGDEETSSEEVGPATPE
jgi:hypothetical protein